MGPQERSADEFERSIEGLRGPSGRETRKDPVAGLDPDGSPLAFDMPPAQPRRPRARQREIRVASGTGGTNFRQTSPDRDYGVQLALAD